MGKRKRNFCKRCGVEITDRTYNCVAVYCKKCVGVKKHDYLRDYSRVYYKNQRLIAGSILVSIKSLEVEKYAGRSFSFV